MLSERLRMIHDQHKRELRTVHEDLQKSYEQKRHDAFSKLVSLLYAVVEVL